jgi:hypothetical protein
MLNPYFIEIDAKLKQEELARAEHIRKLRQAAPHNPSPFRQSVASAIVRFGMFLDSGAYRCPDAATQQ